MQLIAQQRDEQLRATFAIDVSLYTDDCLFSSTKLVVTVEMPYGDMDMAYEASVLSAKNFL